MLAPVTKMQKSCSTEALSTQEAVTLEDVLHNDGAASVLIKFLKLKDKGNLRLVAHACKDAVDRTVTAVANKRYNKWNRAWAAKYFSTLAKSNWKGIKKINMAGFPAEPEDIIQIAEAGFSKLESLSFLPSEKYTELSAVEVINAGWELKELVMSDIWSSCVEHWFEPIMREAMWPLESLTIKECTSPIAAIIGKSDWPLKRLKLEDSRDGYLINHNSFSPEAVEQLMKGSWVATIESLDFPSIKIRGKGSRTLSEAINRTVNLKYLNIVDTELTHEDALILGEGSYPQLKKLIINIAHINISGLIAILKKCPVVEVLESKFQSPLQEPLADPEDAKSIAEHMRMIRHLDLTKLFQLSTPAAACSLLLAHDWSKVESLVIGNRMRSNVDINDEVIAALVQNDWPCLRKLKIKAWSIEDEGYRMFSAKEWPVLEDLELDIIGADIELDPEMLPRLETLKLDGDGTYMVTPGSFEKLWPHLKTLTLEVQPDLQHYSSTWILKELRRINRSHMPNLKLLLLNVEKASKSAVHDMMALLEQEAERIGCVVRCAGITLMNGEYMY